MSDVSTGKIVRHTLDPENPPSLTEEQRHRLTTMRDEDIDLSDIPEQSGAPNWSRPGLLGGPVGRLRREALKEKLLLLDEDVAAFFKETGESPADRMNAILREFMEAHRKTA